MPDYLKARLFEILSLLLKIRRYVTLQELADKLGVSKRTIQHDVERVELWLKECGLENSATLLRKQGLGIRLELKGNAENELEVLLSSQSTRGQSFDNYERRLEVAKFLLSSHDDLTLQFLADQFYVSKGVINKDLTWVSSWLKQYGLGITRRQNCGVKICGSEQKRRTAMAGLITLSGKRLSEGQEEQMPLGDAIDVLRLDLKRFYTGLSGKPKADVGEMAKIIHDAEKKYDFYLMDSYYTSLLVHLSIAVERLSGGQSVVDSDAYPESILEYREGEIAKYIAWRMEEAFHICIPNSERSYICIHLMGAELPDPGRQNEMHSSRINTFTQHFTAFVESMTGASFQQDEVLTTALATHIKTSVFRLQSGMTHHMHYTNRVPEQLKGLYQAIWAGNYYYKHFFNVEPGEEEIYSVFLHFVHSLRRRIHRCRTVVLYQCDILRADDVYQRLSMLGDELDIQDIRSWGQRTDALVSDCELIIAVGGELSAKCPVIQVSTPITGKELNQIRDTVLEIRHQAFMRKTEELPIPLTEVSWFRLAHGSIEDVLKTFFEQMVHAGVNGEALSRESLELERDGRALIIRDTALLPLYLPGQSRFRAYGFQLSEQIAVADGRASRLIFLLLRQPDREGDWPEDAYPHFIRGLLALADEKKGPDGNKNP